MMRNGRNAAGAGAINPRGYNMGRPGTGGMMPGMPGTNMMPGAPGAPRIDDDWELVSRAAPKGNNGVRPAYGQGGSQFSSNRSPSSFNSKYLPQGSGGIISGKPSALLQGSSIPSARPSGPISGVEPVPQYNAKSVAPTTSVISSSESPLPSITKANAAELRRKTISLLEEYFSVRLLDEAQQCVEELKAPAYHSEVVKEAITLALEKIPPCVEPVIKLLEFLLNKNVLTTRDLGTGCLLYASSLEDVGIDLPKAPNNFGEVIGNLVISEGLDFKIVKEILKNVGDEFFQKTVFAATMKSIQSTPAGQQVLAAQGAEIEACESMLS